MVCGIILTVLVVTYIVINGNVRKLKPSTIVLLSILVIVVLGGVTVWGTIDLAGISKCITSTKTGTPVKSVCESRHSNLAIPDLFCNYKQTCECYSDSTCSGDCKCINTKCISSSGSKRIETKTRVHLVNYLYIVTGVMMALIIPFIILDIIILGKWNMRPLFVWSIIILFIILCFVPAFISYIKVTEVITSSPNCPPPPPPSPPPSPTNLDLK